MGSTGSYPPAAPDGKKRELMELKIASFYVQSLLSQGRMTTLERMEVDICLLLKTWLSSKKIHTDYELINFNL